MAKYRETVCLYYVALGECKKGRDACHEHYCQKCNKYYPRAKRKAYQSEKEKYTRFKENERYD